MIMMKLWVNKLGQWEYCWKEDKWFQKIYRVSLKSVLIAQTVYFLLLKVQKINFMI